MTTRHQSILGFALCKNGNPNDYCSHSICLAGLSHSKSACTTDTIRALGKEYYEKLIAEGYKILPVKITIDNNR